MAVNLTWIEVVGNDIQGAVNRLPPGGGTVYLPAREYHVATTVRIDKPNVTVLGDGPGEIGASGAPSTLVACPTGGSFPVFRIEKSRCTIRGLRVTQLGIPQGGPGIGIQVGGVNEIVTGSTLRNLILDS